MPRRLILLAAALVAVSSCHAQAGPVYEVASIRPSSTGEQTFSFNVGLEAAHFVNVPLSNILLFAYDIHSSSLVEGMPNWADSALYNLEAKSDEETIQAAKGLPEQERDRMARVELQHLLAERFGLKVSHLQKERAVYALTVAKGGSKLKQIPEEQWRKQSSGMQFSRGLLSAKISTIAQLTEVLSQMPDADGHLVIDKTGLTGRYDWELQWADASMHDPSKPSLFTALQEQLGLKIEQQKAVVDVLVIDHLERPTEN